MLLSSGTGAIPSLPLTVEPLQRVDLMDEPDGDSQLDQASSSIESTGNGVHEKRFVLFVVLGRGLACVCVCDVVGCVAADSVTVPSG